MAQTTFDHSFGFGSYSHFLNDENHDPDGGGSHSMADICFDSSTGGATRVPHSVYLHHPHHHQHPHSHPHRQQQHSFGGHPVQSSGTGGPMLITSASNCGVGVVGGLQAPPPLTTQNMNIGMQKLNRSPDLAVLGSSSSLCSDGDGSLNFLAHKNAANLRRFIRLPKAYRWIMSEWFYSNIDRALFLDDTDFQQCLRATFPALRGRRFTRMQWSQLRRLMGRPRRCSPGFLAEERRTVADRRERLRVLERWVSSVMAGTSSGGGEMPHQYLQLIETLPMGVKLTPRLLPGTRVIVRLYTPRSGLFLGVVHENCNPGVHSGVYTVWVEEALVHPVIGLGIPPMSGATTGAVDEEDSGGGVPEEDCLIDETTMSGRRASNSAGEPTRRDPSSSGVASTPPSTNTVALGRGVTAEFTPELRVIPDTDVLSLHAPGYLVSLAALREGCPLTDALIPGSLPTNTITGAVLDSVGRSVAPPTSVQHHLVDHGLHHLDHMQSRMGVLESNHHQQHHSQLHHHQDMTGDQVDPSMLFASPMKPTLSLRDPVMGSESGVSDPVLVNDMEAFGSYNFKFLVSLAKFNKLLNVKRKCIDELKDMNSEAEKIFSEKEDSISLEFQHNYATLIVQLDKLNKELKQHIDTVVYCTNEDMWRYSMTAGPGAGDGSGTAHSTGGNTMTTDVSGVGVSVDGGGGSVGPPGGPSSSYITLMPPNVPQPPIYHHHHLHHHQQNQHHHQQQLPHQQQHLHQHAVSQHQQVVPIGGYPVSSGARIGGGVSGVAPGLQPTTYYYPTLTPHHQGDHHQSQQQQQSHPVPQQVYQTTGYPPAAYTMSQDQGMPSLEQVTDWRRRCEDEAVDMINRTKVAQGHQLNNAGNIDLITKLTTMLVQIRNLAETRSGFAEVSSVQEVLKEVRSVIASSNIPSFEANVEYHVNHILNGISQYTAMNYNTVAYPTNSMQFM